VGIPALVVQCMQRNLSDGADRDMKCACAPAPQLEDGEWEAPAKLACGSSAERPELAGG
jgi:hypothetical protein